MISIQSLLGLADEIGYGVGTGRWEKQWEERMNGVFSSLAPQWRGMLR